MMSGYHVDDGYAVESPQRMVRHVNDAPVGRSGQIPAPDNAVGGIEVVEYAAAERAVALVAVVGQQFVEAVLTYQTLDPRRQSPRNKPRTRPQTLSQDGVDVDLQCPV